MQIDFSFNCEPCLSAVSVDGDIFPPESLDDEVGDDATVVHVHPGAISVEDASHANLIQSFLGREFLQDLARVPTDLDPRLLGIGEPQRLRHPLALVIAGPGPDGVHVAPVALWLRVDLGISVHFGG